MTERVESLLNILNSGEYKNARKTPVPHIPDFNKAQISMVADRFCYAMSQEEPVFIGGLPFNRFCLPLEWIQLKSTVKGNNIVPDYEFMLAEGLCGFRRRILSRLEDSDPEARLFYDEALRCLDACEKLANKYRDAALKAGDKELYEALCVVPMNGARDYFQATLSVKFVQFILRLNENDHLTFGRFDQYMRPYFDASRTKGASDEALLEMTELFFLSVNLDTDIYYGAQRGDNGQSMVLGGSDDEYSDLTELCLAASEELKLIDPKINLRVNPNTPLSVYERGTRLTKQGLGFPQYLNDDVIIKGLVALGYDREDAKDYAVAACWEPIIPALGNEVPNMGSFNFPEVVRRVTVDKLAACSDYESFEREVMLAIDAECEYLVEYKKKYTIRSDALFSIFVRPCIEAGMDVSRGGAKYKNSGMHGTGIAPAADALEAIERAVYIDKAVTADELIAAMEADFEGYGELQQRLLGYPKMGNNEDSVDRKACFLMECFSNKLNGMPNGLGGIWRAGTGSALCYYLSSRELGATADGRRKGDFFGANYSPSLVAKLNGPLSAVQSFTKFDLSRIINGGPYTIELHDTVFRNPEGEKKAAMLIKSYIDLGGHQIQINSINRETLLDAEAHPEKYPNLIVRVWGWSGYFAELDKPYRDHIIRRTEYSF